MSTSVSSRSDTAAAAAPAKRSTTPEPTRLKVRRVLRYVVLTLVALAFISPLIFMLVTSFKTRQDATSLPPEWIPSPFSLDAYRALLAGSGETPVLRWFANSMVAAGLHALLVVTTSAMAAYALARMEFRGKSIVFGMIRITGGTKSVAMIIANTIRLPLNSMRASA